MCIDDKYDVDFVIAVEVKQWPEHVKWKADGVFVTKGMEEDIKGKGCYAVSKIGHSENGALDCEAVLWRLSFSEAEKTILSEADLRFTRESEKLSEEGQCRKNCMKLFKKIIILLKEKHPRIFTSISTYHAKTVALTVCSKKYSPNQWVSSKLGDRLIDMINFMIDALTKGTLNHYFLGKGYNLFNAGIFQRPTLAGIKKNLEPIMVDLKEGKVPGIFHFEERTVQTEQ